MEIVDAFVVTLGLDPREYKKESDKFRSDLKRTKEDARRTARDIESDAKRSTEYFGKLKNEVVGVVLAIASARSMGGLIADMVTGAAATGRLAGNLGIATERLGAWQLAVESVGGQAADADQALQAMVSAYQAYRLTGTTGHDADFQGLGVRLNDLQNPEQALLRIAAAGERLGRPEFAARLQRIGLTPAAINLLERGRQGVQGLTDDFERNGAATQRDAEAAQRFEMEWTRLTAQLRSDLRPILTWLLETGLPMLHEHMGEVAAGAAGLGIGIAALTFEIWAIPAAVAAAGAALVWLGDRFHALDAWRDFALHVQSLRIEGELLGIPNDARDESVPLATRREHAAQRMRLLQQLQAITDERWQINQRVNGGDAVPPMPNGQAPGQNAGGGTSGAFASVAARIRATEGGRAGYNATVYGLLPRILTSMSLGDVNAFQPSLTRASRGRRGPGDPGSSGVGAYQFERGTLASIAQQVFGPGWRSQIFSQANQDRLAEALYNQQGLRPWALGGVERNFRASLGGARAAVRGGGGSAAVHVGTINVYTPHGTTGHQADAVARAIPRAVARRTVATQANSGLR